MRSLFMLFGPLLIVGATIIYLRDIDGILPPTLGAALCFATGLCLLWLAFRPHSVEPVEDGASDYPDADSYDRTAIARLQESLETPREPPERAF